ncbi:MAG: ankyrin repeat domain-containing protein [Phycisphaerales bacterium]|nr:ankyrin repeat domain-containing protein [Phycisphaerales bacterium]
MNDSRKTIRRNWFAVFLVGVVPVVVGVLIVLVLPVGLWFNSTRNTAFYCAARGDTDCVRQFIENGLLPDTRVAHAMGLTPGATMLMLAASSGSEPCVRYLVGRGASITAVDEHGACAADYALEAGHSDIAELLAELASARNRDPLRP